MCDGIDNDCDGRIDEEGVCERVTTFVQDAELDILLVVDPRPEAAAARVKLTESLPSLLTPLARTSRHVNVAVASMDAQSSDARGRLSVVGGQTFASLGFDGYPASALEFLNDVFDTMEPAVGRLGARFVTQEALLMGRPFNEGFARDGAYMAVLYLSTTEDREEPGIRQLVQRMDMMWEPGRWSASAVVQRWPHDCFGNPSTEHMGESYRILVDETEGMLQDHCADNYDTYFRRLAEYLEYRSLRDSFVLFEEQDPQRPIVVEVDVGDGFNVLDERRWRFDGPTLRFDRPPPPNASIRVSYSALP